MTTTDAISPPIAARRIVYCGRRWSAVTLFIFAPVCAVMAASTAAFDDAWLAMLLVGLPFAFSAYLCAASGWSEAIARVELDDQGLSLVLPSYRGFLPVWPAQRLTATWPEVKDLRELRVRGRILIFDFDYVRLRLVTDRGEAVLIEPVQSGFWGEAKGVRQNIPAGEVVAEIERRTGLARHDDGEVRGGGVIRNLLVGGPK